MKKAAIILPTYNEAGSINKVIKGVFDVEKNIKNWELYVLVVDSKSKDKTYEKVVKLKKDYKRLSIISTKKEGLGKAYVNGFQHALKEIQPYIIFEMDADLSHDPREIPNFLKKIESGADFVLGSRYIKGGSIPEDWAFHRKLFSTLGNWVIKLGFMNLKINDWTSGFRAIKSWIIKDILPNMDQYSGYVFQVAGVEKAIKLGANIKEVPIKFIDRKEGVSKINSIQFIIQTLTYVLLESSFIKFIVVGSTGFLLDFTISYLFIEKFLVEVWLSTMISTESAIISNFLLNNFWSFSHKKLDNRKSVYAKSFVKFNMIASVSIAIQTIGMSITTHLFSADYWYIYKVLIILFIIIPYSYFFYNKFVWKSK
jgi:dolichol-phosphate mannosyltransferase